MYYFKVREKPDKKMTENNVLTIKSLIGYE